MKFLDSDDVVFFRGIWSLMRNDNFKYLRKFFDMMKTELTCDIVDWYRRSDKERNEVMMYGLAAQLDMIDRIGVMLSNIHDKYEEYLRENEKKSS